jgi:hypothetical protein
MIQIQLQANRPTTSENPKHSQKQRVVLEKLLSLKSGVCELAQNSGYNEHEKVRDTDAPTAAAVLGNENLLVTEKAFIGEVLNQAQAFEARCGGITGIQALAATCRSISHTVGLIASMRPNLILRYRSKYLWRIDEAAAPEGFV